MHFGSSTWQTDTDIAKILTGFILSPNLRRRPIIRPFIVMGCFEPACFQARVEFWFKIIPTSLVVLLSILIAPIKAEFVVHSTEMEVLLAPQKRRMLPCNWACSHVLPTLAGSLSPFLIPYLSSVSLLIEHKSIWIAAKARITVIAMIAYPILSISQSLIAD